MSGNRNGAQDRISEMQPLALYIHGGAHCANLVTQAACTASSLTPGLGPQAWLSIQIVRQIENKMGEHGNCSIRNS